MATIYNSDLSKELQQGAKIQVRDKIPSELAEKVVPVMEVNPKLLRRCEITAYVSGNATGASLITLQNKPFYLCTATIDIQADVTDDSTVWELRGTINGEANKRLLILRKLTTTVTSKTISITFNVPIKLDGGTAITLTGGGTVGTRSYAAGVTGYYDDLSLA